MDKTFWLLLLAVFGLFSLYLPINIPREKVYSFKTYADDLIPLWTPFIMIYISYFGFLIFTLIYFVSLKFYKAGKVVMLGIIISCTLSYLFYLLFQNSIDRPVIESKNFFDMLYLLMNSWVAPYNAFPSLHVAITTICVIDFWKIKSKIFKPMFIWGILIIISTVLAKQHYFLDVLSGLILGWISFRFSKSLLKKYSN